MGKHIDISASETLILEAVNYAIHHVWMGLQQKWHGDIYPAPANNMDRNIRPRVLNLKLNIEDIDVVPTDMSPGPNNIGDRWAMVKRNILAGKDVGPYSYQLSRSAVATAIVTADHRKNPVSFYMHVVVTGIPDNTDKGYKGHWGDWEVRGEVTEIATGQVTSIYIKDWCRHDCSFQFVNGERVFRHVVSINYFTYGVKTAVLQPVQE